MRGKLPSNMVVCGVDIELFQKIKRKRNLSDTYEKSIVTRSEESGKYRHTRKVKCGELKIKIRLTY